MSAHPPSDPSDRPESDRPEDDERSSSTPSMPPMPPMPKWPEEGGATEPATFPAKLQRAVWLMYAGAALTIVSIPLNLGDRDTMRASLRETTGGPRMSEEQINSFVDTVFGLTIFLGLIGAGLWVLMAIFNKRGKNWARLTATGLGTLNIMYTLYILSAAVRGGASFVTLPAVISMLTLAVAVIALVYLWNPDVRDWFVQQKSPIH